MIGSRLILLTCLAATAAASLPHAGQEAGSDLAEEFRSMCQILSEDKIGDSRHLVAGRDGWVFHENELLHAATTSFIGKDAAAANPYTKPDFADPIPAIVDFNNQLAAKGIELLLVPVPGRPVIYPESVLGQARIDGQKTLPSLATARTEFLAEVQRQGVNVLDLLPLFLEKRSTGEEELFYRLDTHWTPFAVTEAAAAMAKHVITKPWYAGVPRREFSIDMRSVTRPGPILETLRAMGLGEDRDEETFVCRRIQLKTETGISRLILRNSESPIVVIGDSYSTWWNEFDAGLGQQLAAELGFPVDILSTTGGGTTATRINLVRTIRSEPGYLDGKKLLIWCFGKRSLSISREGWRKVPLSAPQ